jgi:hypothetical protein
MSIYQFIGLAVFGCTSFIGGYIFGEWSTYDEKLLSQLWQSYNTQSEVSYKASELWDNNFFLQQLMNIEKLEDINDLIEARKILVSSELLKLEEQIDKLSYNEREIISEFIIDEVKKTIGDDI